MSRDEREGGEGMVSWFFFVCFAVFARLPFGICFYSSGRNM